MLSSSSAAMSCTKRLIRSTSTLRIIQSRRSRLHDSSWSTPSALSSVRCFAASSPWDAEYQGRLARRNKNIRLHPEGHGKHILPGNFVIKKHPKTGAERRVCLEHALGYFWAFKVREGGGSYFSLWDDNSRCFSLATRSHS